MSAPVPSSIIISASILNSVISTLIKNLSPTVEYFRMIANTCTEYSKYLGGTCLGHVQCGNKCSVIFFRLFQVPIHFGFVCIYQDTHAKASTPQIGLNI